MNPERWKQVKELLYEALEMPAEKRPAFLEQACGNDRLLREEVESLILASSPDDTFITAPTQGAIAEAVTRVLDDAPPDTRIGPYRIVEELGRGGMGAVYRAVRDDQQYQQEVAIKLVKRGMDTEYVLERFRYERQILAFLNHPNIARLLDGGSTDDGRPYFVMELIHGKPVTQYCREHTLSLPDRLRLFLLVCGAVAHAHHNLIVHRDLKPANILIAEGGVPKLLDFGIAKVFVPEFPEQTMAPTVGAMRMLTPDYASPEQMRGEHVTTSTDIYSLGLILYELLAEKRAQPVQHLSQAEMQQIVCEKDPAPPSIASKRPELAGDLDNIVLKAIQKEQERRYSSAEQLAQDIRNYLDGLPVSARSDTPLYRLTKFVRRNRMLVGAAAAVGFTLVAGIAATSWQAYVANREHARAEARFQQVRHLANSLLFDVYDRVQDLPGSLPAREYIARNAVTYLDSLAREAGTDLALRREVAEGYRRLGVLQGRSAESNLGDAKGAMESFQKAVALLEGQARDPEAEAVLARTYDDFAEMWLDRGDKQKATDYRNRSMELWLAALNANGNDERALHGLSVGYVRLGREAENRRDYVGAEQYFRKFLETTERLSKAKPDDARLQYDLGLAYEYLTRVRLESGDPKSALEYAKAELKVTEPLAKRTPHDVTVQLLLSFNQQRMAEILERAGRREEALGFLQKMLATREVVSQADPKDQRASGSLARGYMAMSDFLESGADARGAVDYGRKALAVREANFDRAPANPGAMEALSDYAAKVGEKLEKAGRRAEARALYDRTLERLAKSEGPLANKARQQLIARKARG